MIVLKARERPSFYDWVSKRLGLDFYVISSGLQKSIRRWNLDDSMIYTRELIEAWYQNYIWKRIFIYMVEDIWMTNLYIGEVILKHYKLFKESEKDDWFDSKYIYQAVYLLCISPKNRENDNMICLVKLGFWSDEDKEFVKKWCTEEIYGSKSKKIKNKVKEDLDKEFKGYVGWILYNIYIECLFTLWDLNGWDWLCLYFVQFYLIKKNRIWFLDYKADRNEWFDFVKQKSLDGIKFTDISKFEVKDYVYDKHTEKWRKMRRWLKHFFEVWSYLCNEQMCCGDCYKESIFELIKQGVIRD